MLNSTTKPAPAAEKPPGTPGPCRGRGHGRGGKHTDPDTVGTPNDSTEYEEGQDSRVEGPGECTESLETATVIQPEAAQTSATHNLFWQRWGPPFYSPWRRFNSRQDPGSWIATRFFPHNGGMVLQLGSRPESSNPPYTQVDLVGGFERYFRLDRSGWYDWQLSLDLGPVSLRPRGGWVRAWAFAQLLGPTGSSIAVPAPSHGYVTLDFGSSRFGGPLRAGNYRLRFGGILRMGYQGDQRPYGEVIVDRTLYLNGPILGDRSTQAAEGLLTSLERSDDRLSFEELEAPPDLGVDAAEPAA